MQITLPVPYRIEARINRSRAGRTEQFLGCVNKPFDIRSESRMDIHLIAEWQQLWGQDMRDDWKPGTSGNWLVDFKSDPGLSRLIMIDGKFYSPLKGKTDLAGWQPYTPQDFSLSTVRELRSVMDREFGGFYEGRYFDLMTEGDFWPQPDKAPPRMPDLTGRTELGNDLDTMTHFVQGKLSSFVIIDDVVFRKIPEPVIGVFATKDHVKMKITERRDSANAYTTSYFSLNDFQSALDHYEACRRDGPERVTSLEVTHLHVYMPAAFTSNIETAELLKTATQLLESTEKLVSKMPSDIAPLWFAVRDTLSVAEKQRTDAELTQLSEAIASLHAGVANHSEASEKLQEACSIASPAAQRWDTRPILSDHSPRI